MYIKYHIISGILFAFFCLVIFPQITWVGFSLIFFSSVLIDIDHYLYYAVKKKTWGLKKAHNWFIVMEKKILSFPKNERETIYGAFCFLHGIEILIIFLILGFFSKYFLFIFIGLSFHLLLDIIHQTAYLKRIDKLSVIYDSLRYKKFKRVDI